MADLFKSCFVEGCNANAHRSASGKRGYCNKHYLRLMKHGDPDKVLIADRGSPEAFVRDLVSRKTWGKECITWPFGQDGGGYESLKVKGTRRLAHRYICELVHGAPPIGKDEVRHLCGRGIYGCVNPSHIEWSTHQRNMADVTPHGSRFDARGERQGLSKLKEADVRAIRSRLSQGLSHRDIAKEFGVSHSQITSISTGRTWAWLE